VPSVLCCLRRNRLALDVVLINSHTVTEMTDKRAPSPLAEFELLVMLAALRLGPDEAYTVSIADEIKRRTGRAVRRANVHTTLQRLEAKELISTRLGEPRAERGGKPRRLVTLRPSGMASVRASTSAIQAMVGALGKVPGGTT
jgi:PadR family transcriptional regulator, regulatory protein PadR